jgi:uracil-DNA glycosylase
VAARPDRLDAGRRLGHERGPLLAEGGGRVNDRPSREEIDACGGFLRRQLEIVDPLVVARLGLVALEALSRLAPVERGPMSALAGRRRSAYSCRCFTPQPKCYEHASLARLQVDDMLALRALVDHHVELRLDGTVAN